MNVSNQKVNVPFTQLEYNYIENFFFYFLASTKKIKIKSVLPKVSK